MIDYLHSGKLGTIGGVHIWANFNYAAIPSPVPDSPVPEGVDFDTWLGPAPERTFNKQRFHGSWRMFWDYGGGLVTDWGVHLLDMRSEEHTSELQSLMRISYAVFCLKKKNITQITTTHDSYNTHATI